MARIEIAEMCSSDGRAQGATAEDEDDGMGYRTAALLEGANFFWKRSKNLHTWMLRHSWFPWIRSSTTTAAAWLRCDIATGPFNPPPSPLCTCVGSKAAAVDLRICIFLMCLEIENESREFMPST